MRQLITIDDLLVLKEILWPHVMFYNRQVEVIESTLANRETYVPAGNELGKDFIAGFIGLGCFIVCMEKRFTCRIVTTSVAEHHLKVVWGEIGRFVTTSAQPLLAERGGPLVINYQEVRRKEEQEAKNPLNYLIGRVSATDEGLAGHHAEFTLMIGDESSGLDDRAYKAAQGWAKRMLFLGNPNPCANFFKKACQAGDVA